MRPDDKQLPISDPRGRVAPPARQEASNQAAANIVRTQLDSIYNNNQSPPLSTSPSPEPAVSEKANENTYFRTHEASRTTDAKEWKQYHSAWQDYYQKYYEHYYVGAVKQVHESYQSRDQPNIQQASQPAIASEETTAGTISTDEALYDLRNQLLEKVKQSGDKARNSRHFVPAIAAFGVLILFAFLQYNTFIIGTVKAYVSPGQIDPQNIVVDPNASLVVGQEPMIVIPKINVRAPVNYDATPDQASQLKAMENGTAYFGIPGANSKPGQIGNTVISGHSSNDYFDGGGYKFVFALLERLQPGDIFYLHYEGTRYTYSVSKIRTVKPTDVNALVYPTTKPEVTLITCTPLGTALNRLLVTAEQVSPSPTSASSAPEETTEAPKTPMPGNSPTVFERIFGN